MTARITLVRHGRSAHPFPTGLISRNGVEEWFEGYDATGIQAVDLPTRSVAALASDATHIIASDMQRAIESAERLANGRPIHIDARFREAALGIPRWPTRLPMGAWAAVMHVGWTYRIGRSFERRAPVMARAAAAAEQLISLVADGSTALVVTHAVFRGLVAGQLTRRGWKDGGRAGGYRHWSAWSFVAADADPQKL